MDKRTGGRAAVMAVGVVALVVVSFMGCSTLNRALSMINVGDTSSGSATDTSTGAENPSGSKTGSQSGPSAGSAMMPGFSPYQMQFYAVYAIAAPFGGYAVGEGGYRPGQGTVWELSGVGHDRGASTVEHALLRINSDGSQWWRVEVRSDKDSLLYEFLVDGKDTITKVRYKDPDSGQVMEFVPERSAEASAQESAAPVPRAAEADQGKVSKDQETITVKAGTFRTEHAVYSDEQATYRSEVWTSTTVPGQIVRFLTKNLRSGEVSQGELVKIEHGVTTVLQSF